MKLRKDEFDCTEYDNDHPLYSPDNKVSGKFKDELAKKTAIQFVGLKSKMYAIKTTKGESNRVNGVSTRIVRKKIKHKDYVNCLQQQKSTFEKQVQSHRLLTIQQNKKCLSPFDDKRYILPDGITNYAHGHCEIKLEEQNQEES